MLVVVLVVSPDPVYPRVSVQAVLRGGGHAGVAAAVPAGGGEQPRLHGAPHHAPLPLPQHLPPQDSLRPGAHARRRQ